MNDSINKTLKAERYIRELSERHFDSLNTAFTIDIFNLEGLIVSILEICVKNNYDFSELATTLKELMGSSLPNDKAIEEKINNYIEDIILLPLGDL